MHSVFKSFSWECLGLEYSGHIGHKRNAASVAQLDARLNGDQQVVGSTPVWSVTFFSWRFDHGICSLVISLTSADSRRADVSF